jgi:hypothetical protein
VSWSTSIPVPLAGSLLSLQRLWIPWQDAKARTSVPGCARKRGNEIQVEKGWKPALLWWNRAICGEKAGSASKAVEEFTTVCTRRCGGRDSMAGSGEDHGCGVAAGRVQGSGRGGADCASTGKLSPPSPCSSEAALLQAPPRQAWQDDCFLAGCLLPQLPQKRAMGGMLQLGPANGRAAAG